MVNSSATERGRPTVALWDNVLLSLVSLKANKMRALLTMLGIIIGIGSVIAIVTVGDSLSNSITDAMSGFGVENITVSVTQKDDDNSSGTGRMFFRSMPDDKDLLTDEMIAEYMAAFPEEVTAVYMTENLGSGTITDGENSYSATITGVNPTYKEANEINIITGRFINEADMANKRKNAVVSDYLLREMYGDFISLTDMLGQELVLSVNGKLYSFYIAGVYEYEESALSMSGSDVVTTLYLPLTTAKQYNGSSMAGYQSITVVSSSLDTSSFINTTESFFASYYTRSESYTAEASSMEEMVSTISEMMSTISMAIAAIAAISLLVGGIGVMNIMMVSITERTREIGTRKALGAPNGAIRTQFIVESVIICLIGGIIGIAVGVGLGSVASKMLGYAAKPSVMWIAIAVGFSMAIGVFFGYYPANKAAKMDPIDALRYE